MVCFLPPSSVCPLLHHLISFVLYFNLVSLHPSFCSVSQLLLFQCQPNTQLFVFFLNSLSSNLAYFFFTTSGASLITSPVSLSPPISPSPLPPSCLSASASIEGPSVPIHHALHFSLLAGINHKYFIIHHGRLSPAHRQFITAALSAGLPRRL